MAVLFIGPEDTRGISASSYTIAEILEPPRTVTRIKGTELETLWEVSRDTVDTLPPYRIVTNRYEESHRIMQEAHQRQEGK